MLHPLWDEAEGFEKSLLLKVIRLEVGEDRRSSNSLGGSSTRDRFLKKTSSASSVPG
jgi:hypothetical protein